MHVGRRAGPKLVGLLEGSRDISVRELAVDGFFPHAEA